MLRALPLLLACLPACAAAAGSTMVVSATVVESCEVTAGAMAFETLAAPSTQGSARALLSLRCTPGAGFTITLDDGAHAAGGHRRMAERSGTRFLAYDIYHDAAGTRRWSAATPHTGTAPAGADAVTLAAYGRITDRAAVAGEYGDMVTVSIAF